MVKLKLIEIKMQRGRGLQLARKRVQRWDGDDDIGGPARTAAIDVLARLQQQSGPALGCCWLRTA